MKPNVNPLAKDARIPAAVAAIKGWTRTALAIDDEAVISVNELSCAKPGCPPRETVVLVLRRGAPASRLSIHMAIVDVGERDVIQACLRGAEVLPVKDGPVRTR